MPVETLEDVLDWTATTHARLAKSLVNCTDRWRSQRIGMLTDYLADHERALADKLALVRKDTQAGVLHTWCYDYFQRYPLADEEGEDIDFRHLDTDAIVARVIAMHEVIIGLYRYLLSRAEVPSTRELIEGLLVLEQNEIMRMVRDSGSLRDL